MEPPFAPPDLYGAAAWASGANGEEMAAGANVLGEAGATGYSTTSKLFMFAFVVGCVLVYVRMRRSPSEESDDDEKHLA
jgi:hypothetical protein